MAIGKWRSCITILLLSVPASFAVWHDGRFPVVFVVALLVALLCGYLPSPAVSDIWRVLILPALTFYGFGAGFTLSTLSGSSLAVVADASGLHEPGGSAVFLANVIMLSFAMPLVQVMLILPLVFVVAAWVGMALRSATHRQSARHVVSSPVA